MAVYSIIKKSELEGAIRLDAEYYQPEYLLIKNKLKNCPILKTISKNIICGPFGSAILNSDYKKEGAPLLRVNNLNNDFINTENLIFIDNKLGENLKRYKVYPNDIEVSQRGTIAMFSLVTDDYEQYNISANLISILNSNKINFLYLISFLNCKYGNLQLKRKVSGQIQEKITTDDIKEIFIYTPNKNKQENIANIVSNSKKQFDLSKKFYQETEDLLLKELGLENFEKGAEEQLCNIVKFSDVARLRRMDAEYFNSDFERIKTKLENQKTEKLGNLMLVLKGFEPGSEAYKEEGKLFIRVSSLSKEGITDKDQKYLDEKIYEELKNDFQPKVGEILLTKDATPGIAYVLKEDMEGIISGGVLRLKVKENIDPEYVAFCINSIVGKSQAERDAGGSVIAHWKPEQVKNLIIPIFSKEKQEKIADLVKKSHEYRKKAKELLEEAKRKVEDLIENNKK